MLCQNTLNQVTYRSWVGWSAFGLFCANCLSIQQQIFWISWLKHSDKYFTHWSWSCSSYLFSFCFMKAFHISMLYLLGEEVMRWETKWANDINGPRDIHLSNTLSCTNNQYYKTFRISHEVRFMKNMNKTNSCISRVLRLNMNRKGKCFTQFSKIVSGPAKAHCIY